MKLLTLKVFPALGVLFLLIGFVTLLGAVGHIQTLGDIPWLFFGYVGLNVILGVGLCTRERWVLYLLGLNLAGFALLHTLTILSGIPADLMRIGVNIVLAGAVWAVVYSLRGHFVDTLWGRLQGISFLLIWMFVYVYLFVTTLTN